VIRDAPGAGADDDDPDPVERVALFLSMLEEAQARGGASANRSTSR
jgi:hypothetical protein